MAKYGDILWTPSEDFVANSGMTRFMAWLKNSRGLSFDSYSDLQRWSCDDIEGFWAAIWDYFEIMSDGPYQSVIDEHRMPGAKWFAGARLNFAEHVLRHERNAPDKVVFHYLSESQPLAGMTWRQLGSRVRMLAERLRALGIKPGDRVASYMPNVPETMVAMLATTAVGAVWTSAAPEFGVEIVRDRFAQVSPVLLFATDGYRFAGKTFPRDREVTEITAALPSLQHLVWLPVLGESSPPSLGVQSVTWQDLFDGPEISLENFRYERVGSDHPLWVLFSSGTTGLPKALVHGHAGIVVEFYKAAALHQNLGSSSTMFFYSTTGWMMWNTLVWAPMMGGSAVLYDGSPSFPSTEKLWEMASKTGATVFGTSPTFIETMRRANFCPRSKYDLSKVEQIFLAGSPSTAETFGWLYENVSPDLWVTSQSGGTEFCSGILAASPTLPVRAAEIQGMALGFDVGVVGDDGRDVIDQVGEMTIRKPTPSMPLFLWGDEDFRRYRESYLEAYPGRWMHGDFMRLTPHGGAYVYGRSDATLNRFGVRIGSAEIYGTMEAIEGIADSLVVCIEEPGGGFYMPLFVCMKPGFSLDERKRHEIVQRLRKERSPRHVPDEILETPTIPYTLTGKKMEVPVRKLLMGWPRDRAYSDGVLRQAGSMEWFNDFAARRAENGQKGLYHTKIGSN
ncbi:MAG TPA: acetoacetate--CoA ligase [Ensifer sp.]|nr:acetoacetate--CoA ligase [Ensifer sp.]